MTAGFLPKVCYLPPLPSSSTLLIREFIWYNDVLSRTGDNSSKDLQPTTITPMPGVHNAMHGEAAFAVFEVESLSSVYRFVDKVSILSEPPSLIDHISAAEPTKKRWLTVRILFATTALVAIVVSALSNIPRESTIDFPMAKDENLVQFLRTNGIHGRNDRFSWNEVSTIRATPGWGIWLNENAILDHVENAGYFCVIK